MDKNQDLNNQIASLLQSSPSENLNLEFKEFIKWNVSDNKNKILKAILALSNSGGGHILFGVSDKYIDDKFISGLDNSDYSSINLDSLKTFVNKHVDSPIKINLSKTDTFIDFKNGESKKIILVKVEEFEEFPKVFTSDTVRGASGKIILFKNGLYVRSETEKIENILISGHENWKKLIEKSMEKYKKETTRRVLVEKNDQKNNYRNKYI